MKAATVSVLQRRPVRGFTLVELMVVVAIVGILAAVAYPSFMSQVRKGRRSDVVDVAGRVMQAQERWRANQPTYTTTFSNLTSLGASSTSAKGYYTLSLTGASATGYTLTATAVSGTSQASDSGCTTLTVTVTTSAAYTPTTCWSN